MKKFCQNKWKNYIPIVSLAIYVCLLQNWFSFIYLVVLIILLHLEIEDYYKVIKNIKKKDVLIKKYNLKIYIYYFWAVFSFGILIFKIVYIGNYLIPNDSYDYFIKFNKENHENIEYFVKENFENKDLVVTLVPNIVILLISFVSICFEFKKPKIIEITEKRIIKMSHENLKIYFIKLVIGILVFFVPVITISWIGFFFILFILGVLITGLFLQKKQKKTYFEHLTRVITALVFSLNFIASIENFSYFDDSHIGLNCFSKKKSFK